MVGHGISGDDAQVGLLTGASVAIYSPGSTTLIGDTLYTTDSGSTTLSNPFVSVSGIIDFYLNVPQRVDIGITPVGGSENIISAVDVSSYSTALLAGQFAPLTSSIFGVLAAVTVPGALVVNQHNPIDTTSGSVAVTLANASFAGQLVAVEKIDGSANTVTVTLNLRGTPSSTVTLVGLHETRTFIGKSDGSWWELSSHRSKTWLDATYAPLAPTSTVVATSGAAQTIPAQTPHSTYMITLTAACAITMPTPVAGRTWYLKLAQDATGSRTATWAGGSVKWPGGSPPTLTTTANSSDTFVFTSFSGSAWDARVTQDVR
jgi:hypothetical protein